MHCAEVVRTAEASSSKKKWHVKADPDRAPALQISTDVKLPNSFTVGLPRGVDPLSVPAFFFSSTQRNWTSCG
ncbi:hypothetical protein, unlikely [Trypanosoma brucei brucei TREU927]|uniref:Uncharacterized protein n=1 Tax=Trypanosoma brucei brucei (strain 927/4 GUTat10.1) TaxID=185431 RepID=Q4GYT3_TRYB2|nr:hypothetical protein, unlikely [Trypanosoma brucei brucei TREU927]CAJ16472.1 hypothetical protein, unlikely [Trypanosoma brucei brucei TREU927]